MTGLALTQALFFLGLVLLAPAAASDVDEPPPIYNCLRRRGILAVQLILPAEVGAYADARSGSLLRDPIAQPAVYARPRSDGDVQRIVRCADEVDMVFCVRSGGHSWASSSSCPGIVIDMQDMTRLTFDPRTKHVVVQAGKTMGQAIYELHTSRGRIFPHGTCPSVGLGGYVQGGGLGLMTAELGVMVDSIVAVRGVKPNGTRFVARKNKEQGLFWGLRGGGGGYLGVVTEYRIRTTSAAVYDRNVYFAYRWDASLAPMVMEAWAKYALLNDTGIHLRISYKEITGEETIIEARGVCWEVPSTKSCFRKLRRLSIWSIPTRTRLVMSASRREGVLEALKFFGSSGPDGPERPSGPETSEEYFGARVTARQSLESTSWASAMFDNRLENATASHFKSFIETIRTQKERAELRRVTVQMYPLGDKARAHNTKYAAFPHRESRGVALFIYSGGLRADRAVVKRNVQSEIARFQTGSYVNYLDLDLDASKYRKEYWGASLGRMVRLKARLDPNNRMWHPLLLNRNRIIGASEASVDSAGRLQHVHFKEHG